jgi:hypothetical protein
MKEVKRNWKLYGITIGQTTVIPCYYDVLRVINKLPTLYKKHLDIVRFSTILERYCILFNHKLG